MEKEPMNTIILKRKSYHWTCGNGTCSEYSETYYFNEKEYTSFHISFEDDVNFFEWLFQILNLEFDSEECENYILDYENDVNYLKHKHNIDIEFEEG